MMPGARDRSTAGSAALIAVIVALAAVRAAQDLVVPVLIAVIVAVIVAPLERRLIARGWHRIAAYLVVLVGTILALGGVFWTVNLSLSAFIADLPAYRAGGTVLLSDILDALKALHVNLTHAVQVGSVVTSLFTEAKTLTGAFLTSLAGWAVALVLTGFLLYEALDYPAKARAVLGTEESFRRWSGFARDLSRSMGVLTAGAAATAAGDLVVLLALGIPSPLLWTALAFLLSYVPSIGSFVIAIPPAIATLVRFGFGRAIAVLVLMLLVDNLAGLVLVPTLAGRRLSIAPFWGMLSVFVWAWLLGPLGAILSLPLTMFAKFLLESWSSTAPLGALLAPFEGVRGG